MTFLPLNQTLTTSDSFKYAIFGFLLVLIVLAVLALFVKLPTKILDRSKETKETSGNTAAIVSSPEVSTPTETSPTATVPVEGPKSEIIEYNPVDEIPHISGYVVLDGVAEQDAAVIMAITAEKTGVALDHLDFKSIRRLNQDPVLENVEEQDAAAIMAITSDKTGIPLENLIFNSIKLVED